MKLIPNFAWPVPIAFQKPLAICRFEVGDVIYTSGHTGYGPKAANSKHHCYQVRSATQTPQETHKKSGDSFLDNWNDSISLVKYSNRYQELDIVSTTNGRLYTAMWMGSESILTQARKPIAPKLTAANVRKQVSESEQWAQLEMGGKGSALLFGVDIGLSTYSTKFTNVIAMTKMTNCPEPMLFSLSEVGIENSEKFRPTVQMAAVITAKASAEELLEIARKSFYKKTKKGSPENFKISQHGALFRSFQA